MIGKVTRLFRKIKPENFGFRRRVNLEKFVERLRNLDVEIIKLENEIYMSNRGQHRAAAILVGDMNYARRMKQFIILPMREKYTMQLAICKKAEEVFKLQRQYWSSRKQALALEKKNLAVIAGIEEGIRKVHKVHKLVENIIEMRGNIKNGSQGEHQIDRLADLVSKKEAELQSEAERIERDSDQNDAHINEVVKYVRNLCSFSVASTRAPSDPLH